jgi:hypothetical protein
VLIAAFFLLNVFSGVLDTCQAISANSVEDLKGQLYPGLVDLHTNSSLPHMNSLSSYSNMTSNNLTPFVTKSNSSVSRQDIVAEPIKVKVGVELDQISAINQKDQNFDVIAAIQMQWVNPSLGFSPEQCNCSFKIYRSIDQFMQEYGSAFPEFTIFNQQGNRWTQNEIIIVQPNGTATYFERF